MNPPPVGATAFAPGGATAIPAYGTAEVSSADTNKRLAVPRVNGVARRRYDAMSAMHSTWSKARSWVATRPAVSMAASFVAGGTVGWLTSKLR